MMMDYKKIGRPVQEKTYRKNGKNIIFWLDQIDYSKLLELTKEYRTNMSDLLRILIRKADK